jgi:hypothetical protein
MADDTKENSMKMKRSTFIAALGSIRIGSATPDATQVFWFGHRLHQLIYERQSTSHSPYVVISLIAKMLYRAKSVALKGDSFVTTGLDDWGSARLRDLINSYED